jgi:CheY-like chemotaxis protein
LRHIPVHVISIEPCSDTVLKMGAIGYLKKPIKPKQLSEAMDTIEGIINTRNRNILLIEDSEAEQKSIMQLLEMRDVKICIVDTIQAAMDKINNTHFDCIILDLTLNGESGFKLLERFQTNPGANYPPVIVYTGKDLTKNEKMQLEEYSNSIIIKGAKSPERLLDETLLFLHRMETQLPKEKQSLLNDMRLQEDDFDGRTVLLVDDDMRNVFSLKQVLENVGFKVVVGTTGKEALSSLQQSVEIDIILMDIMMPEMDGFEAMRRISAKEEWSHIPIIALTAKAMKGDREKCLDAGATDYLPKPVDVKRLLSLLRIWIEHEPSYA